MTSSRSRTTAPSAASSVTGEVATRVCCSAPTPATAASAATGPHQARAALRRTTRARVVATTSSDHGERARPESTPRREGARPRPGPEERGTQVHRDRRSDGDVRSQLGEGGVADAVDLEELVDRGEGAVVGAPADDGRAVTGPTPGSDSRVRGSAVLMLTSAPVSRRRAEGAGHSRRHGHADQDLLAVDERPGQVERGEVDAAPRPTSGVQRRPRRAIPAAAQRCRGADLAGDVDGRRRSPLPGPSTERPLPGGVGAGRPPPAPAPPARPGRGSRPRTRSRRPPRPPTATTARCAGPSCRRTHTRRRRRVPARDGDTTGRRRPLPSPRMRVVLLVGCAARTLLPSYRGELGAQRRQASRHGLGVLGEGWRRRMPRTLGSRRLRVAVESPVGRRRTSVEESRAQSVSGATQTATIPGPTWAPRTAPSSPHIDLTTLQPVGQAFGQQPCELLGLVGVGEVGDADVDRLVAGRLDGEVAPVGRERATPYGPARAGRPCRRRSPAAA